MFIQSFFFFKYSFTIRKSHLLEMFLFRANYFSEPCSKLIGEHK